MFENFRQFVLHIRFETIKLPDNVRKFAKKIIFFSILSMLIPSILSFALKGAQISIANGHVVFAIVLLLIHFGERVLGSLFDTWYDFQDDNYNQLRTSESTKITLDISNTTKSKVFKTKDHVFHMVEPAEIIKISKDYISAYWAFYLIFPTTIAQIVILIGMFIASIGIEITTSSMLETILISGMLVICVISYFYLSRKRIKVMREFRKTRKEIEASTDVLYTEIKSTDFISQKDFSYHAEKLRKKLDENISITRSEKLKLNKVFIQRSIIASFMMIIIMIIKIIISGGNFTINTFVDVVALSSIYSTILQRISNITSSYESIMDIVVDIDSLYEDFNNINTVYESEKQKMLITEPIESLSVSKFIVTQDRNGAFELINNHDFTLNSGDTVMAYGKTGCGKSTLINMFTGHIFLRESPISFSNGENGYLNSIGYQTDKAMVNNYVINEIALTDDYDKINRTKLLDIICGLQLYDELLRMIREEKLDLNSTSEEDMIFEFLKIRKTMEFSSGQIQRLSLAKLLYSLDDTIQLVALDEPFNRLDDVTCKMCMKYVQAFVLQVPRILFIATHQVEIVRQYSNVEISFSEDGKHSILRVEK